ncbi:DUF3275 family protein [Variovorax sp. ZS18.2.2]|uniref:DUF3275 family protein n=1 Tax=Variovorax sp. ZS18.2.2 TaxID=2971255 RepID=UPI002151F4DC|nr:DUF3275 family protein [Variovorax sp. ZS18.2.2]MCR6481051.1 DUF3275 family protein [Variovorax sp. ZS18.2.2]
MIRIDNATLRVKKIRQSRNGAFCVADLSTGIGEFKVKDTILDQFDEGEYQATVWISEVFLAQYIAYGKAVTEIRARLHDLQVNASAQLEPTHQEQAEPDPLDELPTTRIDVPRVLPLPTEEKPSPASSPAPRSALELFKRKLTGIGKASKAISPGMAGGLNDVSKATQDSPSTAREAQSSTKETSTQQTLFNAEIWRAIEARESLKLDPTVERSKLRMQAAEMHNLGYVFDPKAQTWNAKEEALTA